MTLGCLREAAETVDTAELARAKAQLKVALLSALETPGGRIERTARQLLAWGRVIPAAEVIAKVDAVTPDDVRAAGRALIAGAPTLAAIGPIKKLQSLETVGAMVRGRDRLRGGVGSPPIGPFPTGLSGLEDAPRPTLPPLRGRVDPASAGAGRGAARRSSRGRPSDRVRLIWKRGSPLPPSSAGHPPPQRGEGSGAEAIAPAPQH